MSNSIEMWKYTFSIVAKEGKSVFVKIGDTEISVNKDSKFLEVLEQIDDMGLEGLE